MGYNLHRTPCCRNKRIVKKNLTSLLFSVIDNSVSTNEDDYNISNNIINTLNLPVTYSISDNLYFNLDGSVVTPSSTGKSVGVTVTFHGNELYNPKTIEFNISFYWKSVIPPGPGGNEAAY